MVAGRRDRGNAMLRRQRDWAVLGLVCGVVTALASGCGDDFGSCRDSRTCEPASGGETGSAGDTDGLGTAGLGGISETESGSGGAVGEAGSPVAAGTSAGGASETQG